MTLFNPFVLKKYSTLLLAPCITTILFFIATRYYGLLFGLIAFLVGLLLSVLLGIQLLKNPFSSMLEGKGLICFDFNSTGILQPFLINIKAPYMHGTYKGQKIKDIFDRAAVFQLAPPVKDKALKLKEDKEGKLTITLDQKQFNAARFALYHYPVLIWNDIIKSLLTKDFFSEGERDAFAEHGVLYLNKQVEELNAHLLNFGRYIVENLKPVSNFFKSKWFYIIIIAAFIIIAAMFGPSIIEQVGGIMGPAKSAIAKGAAGGAITPLG